MGHSTERSTVAVLGGEVRGRNAFRRPVLMRLVVESVAATNRTYTDACCTPRQAGQYVSVSGALPLSR